jgi:hypothetical protein
VFNSCCYRCVFVLAQFGVKIIVAIDVFSCSLVLSQSESLFVVVRGGATGDKTMREACEEWGIDDVLN